MDPENTAEAGEAAQEQNQAQEVKAPEAPRADRAAEYVDKGATHEDALHEGIQDALAKAHQLVADLEAFAKKDLSEIRAAIKGIGGEVAGLFSAAKKSA